MLDIEAFHTMVDSISQEIPEEFLVELNGGIMTMEQAKRQPDLEDVYTLGEYRVQIPGLGRYIVLYYGSFVSVFGQDAPRGRMRKEIRKTILHELRHHVESLAGCDALEVEDAIQLEAMRRRRQTR